MHYHLNCDLSELIIVLFQSELKKASRVRAVLQAIAIPRRSYKKNLEEAQKQFESKAILFLLWDQGFPWSSSKFSNTSNLHYNSKQVKYRLGQFLSHLPQTTCSDYWCPV